MLSFLRVSILTKKTLYCLVIFLTSFVYLLSNIEFLSRIILLLPLQQTKQKKISVLKIYVRGSRMAISQQAIYLEKTISQAMKNKI